MGLAHIAKTIDLEGDFIYCTSPVEENMELATALRVLRACLRSVALGVEKRILDGNPPPAPSAFDVGVVQHPHKDGLALAAWADMSMTEVV